MSRVPRAAPAQRRADGDRGSEAGRLASQVWPGNELRATAGVVISGELAVEEPRRATKRDQRRAPAIVGLVLVLVIAVALGTCIVLWDTGASGVSSPAPEAVSPSAAQERR